MNIFRTSFFPVALGGMCLLAVLHPATLRAQDARTRPAARPTASSSSRRGVNASPTPKPSPTPVIIPAAPLDPELSELRPPNDAAPDAAPENETQIDASDGATFASKERIAVFLGNVRVNDTRFQLSCDKLTVFLNKSAAADTTPSPFPANATPPPLATASTPKPAAAGNTPPPPDAKSQGGGGGIDHVIAEGHVIILQKRPPTKPGDEEKVSIGRGEKGTFDNKTGDMTLYGLPSIEQNGNSHEATSPDTVMVIHKDSSLDTKGPSTTKLIQHRGSSGIELPGAPVAPTGNTGGGKNKKANGVAPGASPAAGRAQGQ